MNRNRNQSRNHFRGPGGLLNRTETNANGNGRNSGSSKAEIDELDTYEAPDCPACGSAETTVKTPPLRNYLPTGENWDHPGRCECDNCGQRFTATFAD